jgi:transcriptional regulator with XRE-family HTH domain
MPRPLKFDLPPLDQTSELIGQRIARFRKEQGWSQAALAEMIGITRKLVSDYETGRAHLIDEMVIRFAKTLNVSTDDLLGVSESLADASKSSPSLRLTRRLRELESLPEPKKKKILNTLDDLIKANS